MGRTSRVGTTPQSTSRKSDHGTGRCYFFRPQPEVEAVTNAPNVVRSELTSVILSDGAWLAELRFKRLGWHRFVYFRMFYLDWSATAKSRKPFESCWKNFLVRTRTTSAIGAHAKARAQCVLRRQILTPPARAGRSLKYGMQILTRILSTLCQ